MDNLRNLESAATMVGAGTFAKFGRLSLDADRLVFTDADGQVKFDRNVSDLHSIAGRGGRLTVAHGDSVQQFALEHGENVDLNHGLVMTILTLGETRTRNKALGSEMQGWVDGLTPLAGVAPAGFVAPKRVSEKTIALLMAAVFIGIPVISVAIYAVATS